MQKYEEKTVFCSINRHDPPITHILQQLKNATGCMPLDGLVLL